MNELRFSTHEEALQYLANVSGQRVVVGGFLTRLVDKAKGAVGKALSKSTDALTDSVLDTLRQSAKKSLTEGVEKRVFSPQVREALMKTVAAYGKQGRVDVDDVLGDIKVYVRDTLRESLRDRLRRLQPRMSKKEQPEKQAPQAVQASDDDVVLAELGA